MRLPFDANDIGRVAAPDTQADQVPRRFAVRQIGELPLSVHVGIANEDVAGAWQDWTVAQLVAGVLLASISCALIVALQREVLATRNCRTRQPPQVRLPDDDKP